MKSMLLGAAGGGGAVVRRNQTMPVNLAFSLPSQVKDFKLKVRRNILEVMNAQLFKAWHSLTWPLTY